MIRRTKFDHLAVESKRAAVAVKICEAASHLGLSRAVYANSLEKWCSQPRDSCECPIHDKSGLGSSLKTKGKHQWTKIYKNHVWYHFIFAILKIDPNHPQSELWTGKPLPSALLISTWEVPRKYGGKGGEIAEMGWLISKQRTWVIFGSQNRRYRS